jgi:hypothetical protein
MVSKGNSTATVTCFKFMRVFSMVSFNVFGVSVIGEKIGLFVSKNLERFKKYEINFFLLFFLIRKKLKFHFQEKSGHVIR